MNDTSQFFSLLYVLGGLLGCLGGAITSTIIFARHKKEPVAGAMILGGLFGLFAGLLTVAVGADLDGIHGAALGSIAAVATGSIAILLARLKYRIGRRVARAIDPQSGFIAEAIIRRIRNKRSR